MLKRLNQKYRLTWSLLTLIIPSLGYADSLNGANTAWIITATALVLFMTIPGLSLFLQWLGSCKKCPLCVNAMLRYNMCILSYLVNLWL